MQAGVQPPTNDSHITNSVNIQDGSSHQPWINESESDNPQEKDINPEDLNVLLEEPEQADIADTEMDQITERDHLIPRAENKPPVQRLEDPGPADRLKIVYLIFYLLGIGCLLPWNFFTIAKHYFMYKFRNVTIPYSPDQQTNQTELQVTFEGYLAIAAMLPNVLFMFLNTVATKLIPLQARMILSSLVMIVLFAITVTLSKINTDTWQTQFFAVTLVTVVIMNASSAVLQGGMFGLAGLFPGKYSQAVMAGMGMGGSLAAVANIAVIAFSSDPVNSGFAYFLTAEIVLVMALFGYLALPALRFARHYIKKRDVSRAREGEETSKRVSESLTDYQPLEETSTVSSKVPIFTVFKQIWVYGLSVFSIFFVTLACYPALNSAIRSENHNNIWSERYFTPVTCFLLFNLGDLAGRTIAGWIQVPKHGSPVLPMVCIFRVVFIPLFMMCNVQPRQHMKVFLSSDLYPIFLMLVFAISNGYLGTLCMMYGPQGVPLENTETAGAMMSFFLSLGLSLGSVFSFGLINMV